VDNYQYCAEFATRMISNKVEAKVLDFGCGAGQIVKVLEILASQRSVARHFMTGGDIPFLTSYPVSSSQCKAM
jgi:2-polyprenyl-3-methyl-5-hydroxy-6-metoxy-1,4-benzoquinol methylase